MMHITDDMEALRQEEMTEQRFWGMQALDEDDAFDYGRDVLKEGTYETIIKYPYKQIPLFTETYWYKGSVNKPIV